MLRTSFYIVLLCCCMPALAQDKLETDRPGETRSAEIVKGNHFQAELGFRREKLDEEIYMVQHPTTTLRFGLFNALELRAEVTSQSIRDKLADEGRFGLLPVRAGVKAKVLPEYKGFPSVALMGHVGFPNTSSTDYYSKRLPFDFRALFGNTLTRQLKLQYNAGVKWEGDRRVAQWVYSVSPLLKVSDNLNLFIEEYAFLRKNGSAEHYVDGGAEFYATRNFMVDASAGVGLSGSSSPYFFAVGFSFRVPVR